MWRASGRGLRGWRTRRTSTCMTPRVARPCLSSIHFGVLLSTSSTRKRTWPSSTRTSWSGSSTDPEHRGRDREIAVARRIVARDDDRLARPRVDRLGELADPELRPLEVGDERQRPPGAGLRLAHAPRRSARARSCVPCEKFSRAPSMPASIEPRRAPLSLDERADRGDDLRPAVGGGGHRARRLQRRARNALQPGYTARVSRAPPRSAGAGCTSRRGPMREGAPVLIWPAFTATARSAIVVSSVSPERCEMTVA